MNSIAPEHSFNSVLTFDRLTGGVAGAGARERLLIGAMQAGAAISSAWYFRGFAAGCQGLRALSAEQREKLCWRNAAQLYGIDIPAGVGAQ